MPLKPGDHLLLQGGVHISDCTLEDNVDTGLSSYGPPFDPGSPSYANEDVTVSGVIASRNHGDPQVKTHNTGNGIVLGSVREGTITQSTADKNGGSGGDGQGPAGIWTYDSTSIDIHHDLAYGNMTPNRVDGNGFGLDQNTTDSVMQQNLSYGNDGTGFLVYSALKNGAEKNNIVRYNISSDDGRDGSTFYGGMAVIGQVANIAVYQNTVVMTPPDFLPPGVSPPALRLGTGLTGVTVRNNVFATNFGPVVADTSALKPAQADLQGNDYFAALGGWSIAWGPASYASLPSWRTASSQELVSGDASGFTTDPRTKGPVTGLGAKSVASSVTARRGFALRPGSPLIGAGLNLAALGFPPGPVNYAGQPVPAGSPNIGAM